MVGLEDYLRLCLLLNSSIWEKFFLFRLKKFWRKGSLCPSQCAISSKSKDTKIWGNKGAFVPRNVTLFVKPWTKLSLKEWRKNVITDFFFYLLVHYLLMMMCEILENEPKIRCLLNRTSLVRNRATITNMTVEKVTYRKRKRKQG